jgi:hypothetical protein
VRNHNSGTSVVCRGSIATYDELPKHIRHKLANANHNWSPEETSDMLLWEGSAATSAHIAAADAALAERHYAILASGRPYPRETKREVQEG